MLTGVLQSAATLLVILLFYAMDFVLIRRYDKQRQASGSGRAWDFTLFIFLLVAILILQPIFLPVISYRTNATWGLIVQLGGVFLIPAAKTCRVVVARAETTAQLIPAQAMTLLSFLLLAAGSGVGLLLSSWK